MAAAVAAAATAAVSMPGAPAVAACPGCDEYTFDLPTDQSNDQPVAPETVPTTPTYVPPTTVTPATVIPVAPEPKPDPEKPDTLVDSRSKQGIAPIALSPIDPATKVASASAGSMVPLLGVIGGVTIVALVIGLRRRLVSD